MNNIKKIILAVVFVMSLGLTNTLEAKSQNWLGTGGNETNSKIYYDKLPQESENMKIENSYKSESFIHEPLIVNNKIYVVENNQLTEFNEDLTKTKRKSAKVSTHHFSKIAYGKYNGKEMIFVPQLGNIKAYEIDQDGKGFTYLWETKVEEGAQNLSGILYYNGYIFTGLTLNPSAGTGATTGKFFAVKVDGNVEKNGEKNIADYAWVYDKSGYYWADPVLANGAVVFAGENGVLVSHSLYTDKVFDEYQLGAKEKNNKVRSTIHFNSYTNILTVGTQDSHLLYKIKMNGFKFDKSNSKSTDKIKQLTGGTSVSIATGHIYSPSGGANSDGFSVLDKDLNLIKKFEKMNSQSTPLIAENVIVNGKKYTYVYIMEYITGELIIIKDDQSGKADGITEERFRQSPNDLMQIANSGSVYPISGNKLLIISNGAWTGSISTVSQSNITDMTKKEAYSKYCLFKSNFDECNPVYGYPRDNYDGLKGIADAIERNKDSINDDRIYNDSIAERDSVTIAYYNYQIENLQYEIDDLKNSDIGKAQSIYTRISSFPVIEGIFDPISSLGDKYTKLVSIAFQDMNVVEEFKFELSKLEEENYPINYESYIKVLQDLLDNKLSSSQKEQLANEIATFEKKKDEYEQEKSRLIFGEIKKDIKELENVDELYLKHYTLVKNNIIKFKAMHPYYSEDEYYIEDYLNPLLNWEKELEKQKKDVDSLNARIEKIDPLNVSMSQENEINSIISAYGKINKSNQKYYIKWYDNVLDAKKVLDNKTDKVVKNGKTTKYLKKYSGKWRLIRSTTVSGSVETTTYYAQNKSSFNANSTAELNGMYKNRWLKSQKSGKTVTKTWDYYYNVKGQLYKQQNKVLNSKRKLGEVYYMTKSYHSNKKVKQYNRYYRSSSKNVMTKRLMTSYRSNGKWSKNSDARYYSNGRYNTIKESTYNTKNKKTKYVYKKYHTNGKYKQIKDTRYRSNGKKSKYYLKNYNKKGKYTSVTTYTYNKKGQLKSNKYGKAYKSYKKYNSRGRLQKKTNYKYNKKGKAKKY